jgi:hypothetical protein
MEYGTLVGAKGERGSLRSWINYSLIDAEGCLLDAQSYIYGSLRTREMRAGANVAIADNASTAPLPSRFLDPIDFTYLDTGETIDLLDERTVQRARVYSDSVLQEGRPEIYGVWNELIQLDCASDAAYTAHMLFYQRPEYLGSAAGKSTNFLTTRYPSLLRSACLMFAADHRSNSEEYSRWQQRTDALIQRANVEADLARRGSYHPRSE